MRQIQLILCLTLALVALSASAEAPPLGVTSRGTLTRVVDGDTVDVEVRYTVRVRFSDCWSPERSMSGGQKATDDLKSIALGKPVVLHIPTGQASSLADVLTLNRVVGTVWLDGKGESLSEYQVRMKNASTTKTGALGK